MADDSLTFRSDRDVASEEVWYDRRSRWSAFRNLPMRRIRRIGLVIAFLLIIALFAWLLVKPDYRTPLITVGTSPYEWPFPPQAWIAEDGARLSELDNEQSIRLLPGASISCNNDGPILDLSDLKDSDLKSSMPIIVYISMCGAARDGVPYLVPPKASPLDTKCWMSIDSLLTQFHEKLVQLDDKLRDRPKLFVLDCSRVPTNWYLGWLENDFAGALKTWWNAPIADEQTNAHRFPNVAILTSAGAGERSWTSAEPRGSNFADIFCRGIAGDADGKDWYSGVSLGELTEYLKQVDERSFKHWGVHQQPMLLSETPKFPDLALKNQAVLDKLDEIEETILSATQPTINATERTALWAKLEQLRPRQLYRFEPMAWRDLEHDLLWLDLLADAGEAYEAKARKQYDELRSNLDRVVRNAERVQASGSIYDHTGLISGDADQRPDDLQLRSLPLAEYFGALPPNVVESAKGELAQFQLAPSAQQLSELRLEQAGLNDFVEAQFVQMLQRYEFPGLWADPAPLGRLLGLRTPVSDPGVPRTGDGFIGDERVHSSVRGLVEAADQARRNVEDQLFVDGQPNLERELQAAEQSAKAAMDTMSNLQKAARVRDRAWAELAYYLQWQADPRRATSAQTEAIDKAINLTKALEQKLFADGAVQPNEIDEIEATLNKLAEQLHDECQTLKRGADAATLLRIEAALANPLLAANDRKELYERFDTIIANLSRSPNPPVESATENAGKADREASSEGDAKEKDDGDADATPQVLSPLQLVGNKVSTDINQSDTWRQQIASLTANIKEINATKDASRGERLALQQRLRAMAPIFYAGGSSADTDFELPIKTLRKIDLRALVLWHAQRALADFWGPAGDAEPYFALAANAYLDSAQALGGKDVDQPDVPPLRTAVQEAADKTKNWLATQATSAVRIDPREPVHSKITVEQGAGDVPVKGGTAAVFVRQEEERIDGVQFQPNGGVSLPIQSTSIDAAIPRATPNSTKADRLEAMTMFRGHESVGSFDIEPLGGVIVKVDPHRFEPGSVTLRSPYKTLDVVLVLDCSQSMEQPLEADKSRLAIAKDALAELLGQLGSREDVHIGVRLFGHRVGWSTDRPVRVLTSPTYSGEIPPDLTPERDVERVLTLGPADFNAAQQVFTALSGVAQGWGQSPLYYALTETLREDFADAAPDSDKHVIVITDGRNYQARPTSGESAGVSGVVQAATGSRIRMHILALAPNAGDDQQAASETAQLASRTGGIYQELSSALDLRQTLNSLIRHDEYQLDNAAGTPVGHGQLGVRLYDGTQESPAPYAVRYENLREDLRFDGGEAIELYIRSNDPQLYAFSYDHDVQDKDWLAPADQQSVLQRVHRPLRDESGVDFLISLQRRASSAADPDSWLWTPRPKASWIEVTPLTTDGQAAGQTYPFYDANFEHHQPVPVLKLKAGQWPTKATRAAISAWYQLQPATPHWTISFTELLGPDGRGTAPHVRDLPIGVQLRADSGYVDPARKLYRVRVIEQHGPAQGNVEWLRISPLVAANVQPAHIERQFDNRYGVAVHQFDYDDPNARLMQQLQATSIGISTRQEALANAAHAESSVVVTDARDLLPLTGGTTNVSVTPPQSTAITPR